MKLNPPQLRSDLTEREMVSASEAKFDLGAGYLHYPAPDWLKGANTRAMSQFREIFDSQTVGYDYMRNLDVRLLKLASAYLGLPDNSAAHGHVTFSGSTALSRAIACIVQSRDEVVIVSPSIDIIPAMFAEHRSLRIKYCLSQPPAFTLNLQTLENMLVSERSVLAFTSPENPTGNVIDRATLHRIAEIAASKRVAVLVDHTFCKVRQACQDIPLWPHFAGPGVDWLMMWDTGKTFPCLNEKLAFIFTSPSLRSSMQSRLNVTQFDISLFSKLLFLNIFDSKEVTSHEAQLAALLSNNRAQLENSIGRYGLLDPLPQAGSFALLNLRSFSPDRDSATIARELLSEAGVGVVNCDCFFPAEVRQNAVPGSAAVLYLRIALGRSQEYFTAASSRLAQYIHSHK